MADFTDFTLAMVLGDDYTFTLSAGVDLTSYQELWFQIKKKPKDADTAALAALTKTGGTITVQAPATNGVVQMTIPRAATLTLNNQPTIPNQQGAVMPAPLGRTWTLYAELAGRDGSGLHHTLKQGLVTVSTNLVQAS